MKALKIIGFLILIYAFILMITFSFQSKLIFFPEKLSQEFQYDLDSNSEEVFIKTSDGKTINGIYHKGEKPTTILYFHGNADSLKDWQYIASDFTELGYSFLIIDCRSFGKSNGKLSEKGLYLDGKAAFNYLKNQKDVSPEDLIIYGRSIGTGVATELASQSETKGLILEAPFTSLKKLANQKMPLLLPSLFLSYSFDNLSKINKVKSPVLFIHGNRDDLIKPSHSEQLYNTFSGKKKRLLIPKAGHNDVNSYPEYQRALAETLTHFFN